MCPRMAYVNKMDIMGADFYQCYRHDEGTASNVNAVPIQLPIGAEAVSLRASSTWLEMKAYVYYDDLGKDIRIEDIPEDMMEKAEEYHAELIEAVAEQDDALMEKYLEGEELTIEEIKNGYP